MKKRLLATLLCLCMVVCMLPTVAFAANITSVWVGGVELTNAKPYLAGDGSAAAADPGAGNRGDSYALFDSSTATLTLSNVTTGVYTWDGNKAGIYAEGALTIKLVGTNTVIGTVADNGRSSYGIFVKDASLTIQNGTSDGTIGSLTATGASDAAQYESSGICAFGVTITGGAVTATGGAADDGSYNIFSVVPNTNDITITGGTVIVKLTDGATDKSAFNEAPILSGYADYRWRTADTGDYTSSTTEAYVHMDDYSYVEIAPPPDFTAPTLTAGAINRTSDTAATVKFTSNEAGTYYYAVVDSDANVPTIDTTGAGTACGTTEQTISLTNLTAGAKTIYIVVKDTSDNVSADTFKIAIPVYVALHTHSPATAWTTNATHHWHECTAAGCTVTENSVKDSYGAHTYDNDSDTTCNTCGYTRTITSATEIPKTGDSSNEVLWIVLLLVSGAGILTAGVYTRKKKHSA